MIIILITQVLTMFLLAAIGMVMFKSDKITLSGSKSLANILLYLALPSVIIQGFLVERDELHVQMLLLSVVAAVAMMVVSILVSRLLFAKDPTAHFASAFAKSLSSDVKYTLFMPRLLQISNISSKIIHTLSTVFPEEAKNAGNR